MSSRRGAHTYAGLEGVPEVLRWATPTQVHAELRRAHHDLLWSRFDAALAAFVDAGVGAGLSNLTGTLSEDSLARLVTAPESARRLLYEGATDLVFFTYSALAEHRRLGEGDDLARGVWTALGDCYFPPASTHSEPVPDAAELAPRGELFAPRLSNGIVVDYLSPHATRAIRSVALPVEPLAPHDVQVILTKLEAALELIASVSREAHELVSSFTQVAVVGRDRSRREALCAWSIRDYIGRVLLANVDTQTIDVAHLANSLVHEAIHSFLYIIENRFPILEELEAAAGLRVESPWTKRSLPLHSFFHACYVWFGLWQFWRLASAKGIARDRAGQMIEQSRSGFDSPAMQDALVLASPYLSSEGRSVVALVHDVRRGAYD